MRKVKERSKVVEERIKEVKVWFRVEIIRVQSEIKNLVKLNKELDWTEKNGFIRKHGKRSLTSVNFKYN